jgi:hypothetical protein
MRLKRAAAVLATATTLFLTVTPGASWAAPTATGVQATHTGGDAITTCPPDPWWVFKDVTVKKYSLVRPAYGESGITIQIVLTAGVTATAGVTITGTGTVSGIIASASVAIGVSLSLSLTASVAYSGSYHVPTTVRYAWLYAGAVGRRGTWEHWQYVGCVGKRIGYGSFNAPHALPAFWHVDVA